MRIEKSEEFGVTLSLDEDGDWIEATIEEIETMPGRQPHTLGMDFRIARLKDVKYESALPVEKGEFEEASMFLSRRQLKEKLDSPLAIGSRVAVLCKGREASHFAPYIYAVEKLA